MTEGLADIEGRPTPALLKLYELWGNGGAGLLVTGNAAVNALHLERPGNIIVNGNGNTDGIDAFRRWTNTARCGGAGVWLQINHAGRQTPALVNPAPLAPSAVPLNLPGKQFGSPRAMTEAQILETVADFVSAAVTARESGFTGVQIHAAHGYLVSQFLSPIANVRTDNWGGSLENRSRFLLEIVKAVRSAVGSDFTLAVKLNSADFQRGGFSSYDSIIVAQLVERAGVDLIEVSGGDYQQPRMMNQPGLQAVEFDEINRLRTEREAYFLAYATALLEKTDCPIMVTGGFRSSLAMQEAVARDGVAIVGLGRPMVLDPDAPKKLLNGLDQLDRTEDHLRVGRGLLGPQSPSKIVRAINGFGALHWQYQQLRRLADGRGTDLKLGLITALIEEYRDQRDWMRERKAWLS
jgi:2,4-dienoyl-CoA reductase-like NADH-dependent reductase (Old Yellow Enzyme family)